MLASGCSLSSIASFSFSSFPGIEHIDFYLYYFSGIGSSGRFRKLVRALIEVCQNRESSSLARAVIVAVY